MTWTGCQYTQILGTHAELVSEEAQEASRDVRAARKAQFPDASEEDSDDQDSFTKLLAELNLEIEEEVDIELGELEHEGSGLCPTPVENQEAEVFHMAKELDVRIDHPASASGTSVEHVQPLKFSQDTQEVPGLVAELKPEELTGNIAPDTEHACSAHFEEEEEILYSDIATPEEESAHTVDNDEVQRTLNLDAIFSFLDFEGNSETRPVSPGITTSYDQDDATARDIINQMVTDKTFSMRDDDVTSALSHTGNEFTSTPERGIVTLHTGEECFQLGRGDCSPTATDRKENSEDKLYFHPVRLPCQSDNGDAYLSVESRLSSPQQQRAASPFNSRNAGRRPITRIQRTPISPLSSRMRAFNREFGYKTRKHPISCHQSDIRRWIISDSIKESRPCRPLQYSTGS